eukprot:scaffold458878_cov33-Prasinocladus_malaysianus.AAC.1
MRLSVVPLPLLNLTGTSTTTSPTSTGAKTQFNRAALPGGMAPVAGLASLRTSTPRFSALSCSRTARSKEYSTGAGPPLYTGTTWQGKLVNSAQSRVVNCLRSLN